jgi:hypothetical protein
MDNKNWTRCYRPPKVRPSGGALKGELLEAERYFEVWLVKSGAF